jgi:hypothetical protein
VGSEHRLTESVDGREWVQLSVDGMEMEGNGWEDRSVWMEGNGGKWVVRLAGGHEGVKGRRVRTGGCGEGMGEKNQEMRSCWDA